MQSLSLTQQTYTKHSNNVGPNACGMVIGSSKELVFQGFRGEVPYGERLRAVVNDGDIYLMDDVACGFGSEEDIVNVKKTHYRHSMGPVGLDVGDLVENVDERTESERHQVLETIKSFTPSNAQIRQANGIPAPPNEIAVIVVNVIETVGPRIQECSEFESEESDDKNNEGKKKRKHDDDDDDDDDLPPKKKTASSSDDSIEDSDYDNDGDEQDDDEAALDFDPEAYEWFKPPTLIQDDDDDDD